MATVGRPSRKLLLVPGAIVVLLVVAGVLVGRRTRNIDDWTRDWVVRELEERFASQVDLKAMHVTAFPEMSATGKRLSIHYYNRTDLPTLIYIEQFTFHLGWRGILNVPRHIRAVHIDQMSINVPPRHERVKDTSLAPTAPKNRKPLPKIEIGEVTCANTSLMILPKKEGKDPLDFEIHDLVLGAVQAGKPFSFHGELTNAKPVGEIATQGNFGPWDVDEPGATPVSGIYDFKDADLGPFAGISGILSSTGTYSGQLNELEVEGKTATPVFSLDPIGRPLPLHTEYSATVDGTNGDTYLHPVRATLLHSLIIASGSVVRAQTNNGHVIALDVVAPNARIEDLLRLATKADEALMTGQLNLKSKFLLPPGKQKVIDKLKLDGQFDVGNARFASPEVRNKLESLSRHAQGQPKNPDVGSSVSDLQGKFHLENGVITFKRLRFSVPGANVLLNGTYILRGGNLDFRGHLRLQAKLSETVTGAKSILLKPVDPFFSKAGAGTQVPITITGTREHPEFKVTIFGKSVKK